MPARERVKTKYPGVYYVESRAIGSNKLERIYYIVYRKYGKVIEEKAGRQFQDDMTEARAATLRGKKIEGGKTNKEEREEKLVKANAENNKWTISRLWDSYKASKPSLKGLTTDENRFKNYIKPYCGNKEPSDLISLDIDRLRIKLLKTRSLRRGKNTSNKQVPYLTPGTVRNILELLRRIINYGVNKNLCDGISFKIEMPHVDNLKTEDLTPDQLTSLLKTIDEEIQKGGNLNAAHIMKLALYTGMRRAEMFKLQWKDIDLHRGFIHIRDPKGKISQKIPLNEATKEIFDAHPHTSEFVFPGKDGFQRTDIKNAVNKIRNAAGLPKNFRAVHGLRHVYASMLASSGQVDMYTLQKLLTHKSPAMTQRYAHLRDDALQRASNLAGDIINQAMNGNIKKKVANLEDNRK